MLVSGVRRIESQLMLLQTPAHQPLPFARYLTRHDRFFMEINREVAAALEAKAPGVRVIFQGWTERYQEEVAHLVSAAYRGHVDSEINDQYRTIPGARHFLMNIGEISRVWELLSAGFTCSARWMSAREEFAVCVWPAWCLRARVILRSSVSCWFLRQARLGYELLRQTLGKPIDAGCTSVSLTVTSSNMDAIRLYESVGFRTLNTFPALVWEGF